MGTALSNLTDEQLEAKFAEGDKDGSGALDAFELKGLLETTIEGRTFGTEQIVDLMKKYDANGDGVIGLDEFKNLAKEAEQLGTPAALPDDIYELSFAQERLGFSVKNDVTTPSMVVVSKVKDATLVGQISPDDEIYAINGVPIGHQNGINSHEDLARKVKTLTARPLQVAFRKVNP